MIPENSVTNYVPYTVNLSSWIRVLQLKAPGTLYAARLTLSSGNKSLTSDFTLSLHIFCMMPDSLYFCAYVKVITWWHKAWHSIRASKQAQQLPHLSCYSYSCSLFHVHTHIDHFLSSPATRHKTFCHRLNEDYIRPCQLLFSLIVWKYLKSVYLSLSL